MYSLKLIRVCNDKQRYYKLLVYQTLFGTFCVERIYGSVKNKKPTGRKREFFLQQDEAKKKYSLLLNSKIAKGYYQAT